jgi:hypothetical protein
MINQADEIPVTYLNKGHVYSVFIVDTAPTMPRATPVQYRTSIRISFDDRQQGRRPATRWQLWKEGRGTDEAHQHDGKLQGVEYVEARDVPEDDSRSRVNLGLLLSMDFQSSGLKDQAAQQSAISRCDSTSCRQTSATPKASKAF